MTEEHGTPPYDLDAEESVLGSILIDDQAIAKVRDILKPGDFFRDKNEWVFAAACRLHDRDVAINQVTLASEIEHDRKLEALGGAPYLHNLIDNTPTSVHVRHYAEIVKRLSTMRNLIGIAGKISAIGYDAPPEEEEAIAKSVDMLLRLRDGREIGGLRQIGDIGLTHADAFREWADGKSNGLRGVSTGFADIDTIIDGAEPGKFYLMAGRPGMGKTQVLLALARNFCKQGLNVAFYSLEQKEKAIMERLMMAEARIDRFAVRKNAMNAETEERYWAAYSEVMNWPLWIDDTDDITTNMARARLMALQANQKVDVMLFDYIDIAGDHVRESEELRISLIARRLRGIGKSMNIPVFATCQLNREVEKRPDKKPILSDLRYSGSLEFIADVVMLLYSREYYEERGMMDKSAGSANHLEVMIAKNKDGPVSAVDLYYERKTGFIASKAKK